MRPIKLAIEKTYNNKKKNHSKINIPKKVHLELYVYITTIIHLLILILLYLVSIYQYKNSLLSCYFFRNIMKNPIGSTS